MGRGAKVAADAVRSAQERRISQLPRPEYGIVRRASPLAVELVDANILLEEDDIVQGQQAGDLELASGDTVIGMFVGEDDDFVLFDSMSDSPTAGDRKFKGDVYARKGLATQTKIGGQLGATVPGISFGNAEDTLLYRDAAGVVATVGIYRSWNSSPTATAFGTRVTGDTVSRLVAQADGKLLWGPGGAGSQDTNLYRSAANVLRTDDDLAVGVGVTTAGGSPVGAYLSASGLLAIGRAAASNALTLTVPGDAGSARFAVLGDGKMNWGPGTGGADTNLYRDAAGNKLKTDDTFDAAAYQVAGVALASTNLSDSATIPKTNAANTWTSKQRFAMANSATYFLDTKLAAEADVRFQIRQDGRMDWGDGTNPIDITLIRGAAGRLQIDTGSFRVKGLIDVQRAVDTDNAFSAFVSGDGNNRYFVKADGSIFWGDGTAATDVKLYRDTGGNILATDDLFRVKRTTAGTDYLFEGGISTDTVFRYAVRADGRIEIGVGGGTARDVTLSRSATIAGALNVATKLQENARAVWSKAAGPGSNVGTGAATVETDLSTFTVVGGTFPSTGNHRIHIVAAGDFTGSTGDRTVKLIFGATTLATILIAAGTASTGWAFEAWVYGTGAANGWKAVVKAWTSAGAVAIDPTPTDPTQDPATDFVIKTTGTTPTAADEVTSKVLGVDYAHAQ